MVAYAKNINNIEKWCDTKGLNISALKTKIVMFTWNGNWTMHPISVGGSTIALSKTVKFLGVTLDNKLNYNTHIDNVTQKARLLLLCNVTEQWDLCGGSQDV